MSTLKSILLVGASGGLGRFFTFELLKRQGSFRRIGFFHNTSRPTDAKKEEFLNELRNNGVEIVSADDYARSESYVGFDCVMIFIGNHGLHLQPTIIDAAIDAGVRHFYPSEYGADILTGQNWTQRYYKYKVITREHLERRGQDVPDLGWTYYLLGRLTEWSVLAHFGFDNKNATAKIYGTESGRQSLISVHDTVKYLFATLQEPVGRRTYRISGSSPTYAEIFQVLERNTRRRYEVTYLEVESALEEEAEAKERGDVDAELSASHKLIQGREGTLLPQPWDNQRFPEIHPVGFEEALKAAFESESFRKAYGLN